MSKKSLRIAMIGQKGIPAVYGGVERHVEELASRLVAFGHDVSVYVRPYYMEENAYVKNTYKGITLKRVPTVHSKHLDAIVHCFLSSLNSLAQRYDIIHYHAIGPATVSWIPRLCGSNVICTVHGLDWQRKKWNRFASMYLRLGQWASYRLPDRTITVSRTLKEYYESLYKGEVHYIPNGVNIPPDAPADIIERKYGLSTGSYVVFISRLVPEKGCHYLIDAFKNVITDKKLVIVGGSSHSDDYVALLHEKGKDDSRLIFTGNTSGEELAELFWNAYLFVLPSELEGLPIVALEALSFGKCLLASDIPENCEVVQPYGKTKDSETFGYTFRSEDSEDLRNQLQYLIDTPNAVADMASKSRKYVREMYNWDMIADLTQSLYLKVVSG